MKNLAVNIQNAFFSSSSNAKILGTNPGSLISSLLPNIMIVAGIIFFILIIYSGFNIISSGSNDSKSMAKAKQTMTYGVIGFLIVISAYFILQIISYTLTGNQNTLITPKI